MKNRILIIEDNFYKYFTIKQLLETQFNLNVEAKAVESGEEIYEASRDYKPTTVLYNPTKCIFEFIENINKRKLNKLNSEILLILTNGDVFEEVSENVQNKQTKVQVGYGY